MSEWGEDIDHMVNIPTDPTDRRNRKRDILLSAADLVVHGGLTNWSIEACARQAHCAKGLVLHYFKSKEALLAETAGALVDDRWRSWAAALAGGGIGGLDTLWERLTEEARRPSARAILELRLARVERSALSRAQATELQRLLGHALELPADELPAAAVLEPLLEGYLLALLSGVSEEEVKEAFFRYWLSFVR